MTMMTHFVKCTASSKMYACVCLSIRIVKSMYVLSVNDRIFTIKVYAKGFWIKFYKANYFAGMEDSISLSHRSKKNI